MYIFFYLSILILIIGIIFFIIGIKKEHQDLETLKKEKFEYAYKGYNFKVLSVENNMIKQILITRIELKDDKQAQAEKAEATE